MTAYPIVISLPEGMTAEVRSLIIEDKRLRMHVAIYGEDGSDVTPRSLNPWTVVNPPKHDDLDALVAEIVRNGVNNLRRRGAL